MSWDFSDKAKKVRRSIYEQFLRLGRSDNMATVMKETGLSQTDVHAALHELKRGLMVMLHPHTPSAAHVQAWETVHPEHTGAVIPIDKIPRLARYERRLDYERGADVNPAIMIQFLQEIGVALPEVWK